MILNEIKHYIYKKNHVRKGIFLKKIVTSFIRYLNLLKHSDDQKIHSATSLTSAKLNKIH